MGWDGQAPLSRGHCLAQSATALRPGPGHPWKGPSCSIKALGLDWHPFAQVASCDVPTKDGTGFGEVKDAHLQLRGPLHPVQWETALDLEYSIASEHELHRSRWRRNSVPVIASRLNFGAHSEQLPCARWDTASGHVEGGDLDEGLRNSMFLAPLGWACIPPGANPFTRFRSLTR